MDKIEARKALNRIQIGCKRLQARLKNNLFVGLAYRMKYIKLGTMQATCYVIARWHRTNR